MAAEYSEKNVNTIMDGQKNERYFKLQIKPVKFIREVKCRSLKFFAYEKKNLADKFDGK